MTDDHGVDRVELGPGYDVSRLVHGGWQFSAGHRLSGDAVDDAVEVLVASADAGVTTFDCADIYTGVEELYGRFLARWRTTADPAPIQIHTKFVPDYSELERVDRAYVDRIIHRSLRRLGVERLDLVQYYWWRDDVPGMEQTARWLADLRDAGKIRHLAATNLDVERIRRIEQAGVTLIANQVQYSALDRRPAGPLAAHCRDTGMNMLAFGTLAGGFLTDRWLGQDDPSGHENRSLVKYRLIIDEFGGWGPFQALLRTFADVAAEHGVGLASVALRWVLERPHVGAVIVGSTRLGNMARNIEALSFELTAANRVAIAEHLERAPGPSGDVFALERDREGPHGRIMRYDLNQEEAAGLSARPVSGTHPAARPSSP